jgi:hypothetical protein
MTKSMVKVDISGLENLRKKINTLSEKPMQFSIPISRDEWNKLSDSEKEEMKRKYGEEYALKQIESIFNK